MTVRHEGDGLREVYRAGNTQLHISVLPMTYSTSAGASLAIDTGNSNIIPAYSVREAI